MTLASKLPIFASASADLTANQQKLPALKNNQTALISSILQAVAYSQLFDYPLSAREIWRQLPVNQPRLAEPTFSSLMTTLKWLAAQKWLTTNGRYWALSRTWQIAAGWRVVKDPGWLFDCRSGRQQLARLRRSEIGQLQHFLAACPEVRAAALTGAGAVANQPDANDDWDLLIITQPARLWLTRAKLLFQASRLGKKSWPGSNRQPLWCFNVWLTSNSLAVPAAKQNFYTAHDAVLMNWLVDHERLAAKFYQANPWLTKFLVKIPPRRASFLISQPTVTKKKAKNCWPKMMELIKTGINWLIYLIQKVYLQIKIGFPAGNLTVDQAWLHLDQSGQRILTRARQQQKLIDRWLVKKELK